jgi:hypothetical protein
MQLDRRASRLLLAASLLVPALVRADAATEAKLRDALRATTAQLRTLEDEKARWERTEAELKAELQTLRGLPAPKAAPVERKELASLNRRITELTQSNAALRAQVARCTSSVRTASSAPSAPVEQRAPALTDEERKRLDAELTSLRQKLAGSEEKNQEMYRVSKEMLAWLEKIGVGGEPFFGWKRNELEMIAQEYGDRLLEQKVKQQP